MRWLDSNTDSMEINLSKLWETLVIQNTLFQQHKRRFLTVPWTARRSNQLILTEINPEYSLEALMLKLKL